MKQSPSPFDLKSRHRVESKATTTTNATAANNSRNLDNYHTFNPKQSDEQDYENDEYVDYNKQFDHYQQQQRQDQDEDLKLEGIDDDQAYNPFSKNLTHIPSFDQLLQNNPDPNEMVISPPNNNTDHGLGYNQKVERSSNSDSYQSQSEILDFKNGTFNVTEIIRMAK